MVRKQLVLDKDVYYLQICVQHLFRTCNALEGMECLCASINGNMVNNLHFADNIDLIARQLGDLQQLLSKVEEVSTCYGLEVSEIKTEWLVMNNKESINNS